MLVLLFASALATTPPAPEPEISRLSWMTGCWMQVRSNGRVDEQWMAPGGGMMLGMSRTLKDGKVREFEFLRIAPGLDGKLVFNAKPSGQPEAAFPLKEITDDTVVFEDAAHDFPQRILYKRVDARTIIGRIEGQIGGQARSVDYPYTRCPAGN
ncbi:DUF6265 family protein [Caulobacter sp. ErkDOM-E]|uniref:DUF6265 family protein n=1 Tax=Caulobacter sp. ErkDOM-E TaxID=3402778 RepID=UPI003AF5E36D